MTNIIKISGYNGYKRYGFENCTSLKNVILNPPMTEIGYQAFYKCTALENIDLSHIKTIYNGAFAETGLKYADMENVETIYDHAFRGCTNLNIEIKLPNLKGILSNNSFVDSAITKVLDLGTVSIIGTGTNSYG